MRLVPAFAFATLVALLAGCASLPPSTVERSTADGQALLDAAAAAHGWDAYRALNDINLRHEGRWFGLAARVQPVLIDADYRVRAEERILVGQRSSAKSYSGGRGSKYAFRDPATLGLWYDGRAETDADKRDAAALVLDGYRLFLLGPLFLKEQGAVVERAGDGRVDGRACDWLLARIRPGLGNAAEDRVQACVDREHRRFLRIRLSIEGLASTRGAVVEVDYFDYLARDGVQFPTRWFERVKRPIAIDVREWWMTGLDLNRGYGRDAIAGPALGGAAARPAAALRPATRQPSGAPN
jgi:hypothetical protein